MRLAAFGFLPTGFAVIVSFALAKWGFKNLYYVSQLLPLFMVFYLALAWFIHLRHTSFLVSPRQTKRPIDALGHHEPDMSRGLPEDKSSGEELLHVRDEHGLIFRNQWPDVLQDAEKRRAELLPNAAQTTAKILLWSACQIGLLATILYHWFGIGSTFH